MTTTTLERYNLLGSIVSDATSNEPKARPLATVTPDEKGARYRRIGQGHCGSVWAKGDASYVLKRADGAETRYLWKEYYMQTRMLEALARMEVSASAVRVPHCHFYCNRKDYEWWDTQLPHFPSENRAGTIVKHQASNATCSERIPPVSKGLQQTLIDRYCPARLKNEILKNDKAEDCIARLYLGRRRFNDRQSAFFSLRNIPLWLDMIESLNLPISHYAEVMAEALAIMHWEAEIDAGDVEFVLGSPRAAAATAAATTILPSSTIQHLPYNTTTRWEHLHEQTYEVQNTLPGPEHEVWLLDFDCCGRMTMNDAGVEKAVGAFYRNDPYYPRPSAPASPDFGLWQIFSTCYLATSESILRRRGLEMGLARRFVDRVVEKQAEPKEARNAIVAASGAEMEALFYKAFV